MDLAGNTFFFDWEVSLIVWLQAHMGAFGTALASFISAFGEELACVAVIGFLYWCYDKRFGRFVGLNVLVGIVLNPMIKNIFVRRRPYFDNPEIQCLKPVDKSADIYNIAAQEYSFPSGHSTNAVAVYGSVAEYSRNKVLTVIAVVLSLVIGVSRFCLGVHYPTDVLCGWLLGLVVIIAVPLLQSKFKNPRLFYGILLLITLPGFFYCKSADYFSGYGMMLGFVIGNEFEQRYVNFENTRSPLRSVLRVVGGVAVFFGLNTLLKLPFSSDFLNSGTSAAFLVRTLRYALVIFADIGLYPLIFNVTGKWFNKA
ncbi:MAG: phosphatase PAP2 family protein [Oscillospiraceae bacterium]|nr:phosphatase PAP2 family protein [Oscillospiraceae bacterium]